MRTLVRRTNSDRQTLAVLCPVYNEEHTIPLFTARLVHVFSQIESRYQARLYFIDNGCTDGSLGIIRGLHDRYPNIFVMVLSRNFGYQCALETALKTVRADLYMMIDVDCEDPPEMLLEFLRHYEEGHDIVYGERVDRPEGWLLKSTRKLYYHLVRSVADENFVLNMAEFSLITAEVRDAIVQDATSFPFLRASIGRIGFRRKNVPYRRQSRIAGETHYNFLGMFIFGVAGILSASTVILRLPAYLFLPWALVMTVLAVLAAVMPAAWPMPALLLLGFGFVGFTTMAAALYVARIYKNGLQRPNAIVRPALSVLPEEEPSA